MSTSDVLMATFSTSDLLMATFSSSEGRWATPNDSPAQRDLRHWSRVLR